MKKANGVALDLVIDSQNKLDEYAKKISEINSYREMPTVADNPFVFMMTDVMRFEFKSKGAVNGMEKFEITDRGTGEVISGMESNIVFRKKQYVDNQQFVKIYGAQLKIIFNLGYTALKVFGYFMSEMQNFKNSSIVVFDLKACMKFCEYDTHPMVYRGLTELIKKFVICKTDIDGRFWINPQFVFNGERIVVFNEFINKDSDHFKELNEARK